MPVLQLTFPTTRDQAELLSDALSELGALAVTMEDAEDQPIYAPGVGEAPLWDRVKLTALFEEQTQVSELITVLQTQFGPSFMEPTQIETIEDQSWEHTWKDDFKAQSYHNRLWIYPSWEVPAEKPETSLILDPGLAFGTGKHPTTQLCLSWLAKHIHQDALLIDYGCGSGILAIAALKLGVQNALAVDNDPQALIATQANAILNDISDTQLQTYLPEEVPDIQADILIANILAQPLIELSPIFQKLLKPKGKLILSGLLSQQIPAVTEAYHRWIDFEPAELQEDWVCLFGQVKS